ncbi:MAG: cation-translocating P-type ATPase [Burkholderiaceae bacterium]|nr:cation-translocating P-type ATPase [Burkholderiaceae bacterium]
MHGQSGNQLNRFNAIPGGLSESEAAFRLARDGPNLLPQAGARSLMRIALSVLREPVFQLLLAAGLLYFFLGELIDALVLSVFVLLSAAISIIQQKRADRVMESLRHLSAPRAIVIRGGIQRRIPARALVRGDLILLSEGDRVAADAILLESRELQVDESLLTGESVPVEKSELRQEEACRVFLGTLVVRGRGVAQVTATGVATEFGRIGLSVQRIEERPGRLSLDIRKLVKFFTLSAILVSILVFLFYWRSTNDWVTAALSGITAAMGLIPEEFAVVLTAFMAMGAWRLSRHEVLTRQSSAIETLGAATVLCTDKTGTLTLNEMRVVAVSPLGDGIVDIGSIDPASVKQFMRHAVLACEPNPLDPMEKAIHALYQVHYDVPPSAKPGAIVRAYGLSPEFSAMTNVWPGPTDGLQAAVMKGAPEVVLQCCGLTPSRAAEILQTASRMADRGLRVLAVAARDLRSAELPDHQCDLDLDFVGLIGLADPLRPSVPAAVLQCRSAGIRVVMITGDYPATAVAIAQQAGILSEQDDPDRVLMTGEQLDQMPDGALASRIQQVLVFARIKPIQKLRIVQMLQQAGEVVGMTGDGVNDAPALKAADIGIAMGVRGTDVAREAAVLVLLQEDFGAIVKAIARGRQIYANLRKAVGFIVSIHIPIAGLAVLPVLLGLPPVFFPVHIAFMEMVIDPAGSFVYESEVADADLMQRPPRSREEFIYPLPLMTKSMLQGLLVLAMTLAAYLVVRSLHADETLVRGMVFVGLVASGLAIISINMHRRHGLQILGREANPAFLLIVAATLMILSLLFLVPTLREVFHFGALSPLLFISALGFGLVNYGLLRITEGIFPARG